MTFAVIMVRSRIDIKPAAGRTLKLLRLNKINHCILVPEDPHYKGMVMRVKDYVTWGEVDEDTVKTLIEKRGKVLGDSGIDDAHVKKNSPCVLCMKYALMPKPAIVGVDRRNFCFST